MKVGLYARVSKPDESQDPENQLLRLRAYASEHGLEVHGEYVDTTSGADHFRPALDRLMGDARAHRFSKVLVVKIDRFARSMRNLENLLHELREFGVSFACTDQPISTDTPEGTLLYQVLEAMAQFERELIRSRTKAGLERARTEGKRLGHPKLQIDMTRVHELRGQGMGYRRIAAEMDVSHQTIRNRLRKEGAVVPKESGQSGGGQANAR